MTAHHGHHRQCLLILGMHRSGTSLTTRVASMLGAHLPSNIMGPALGNDAGHWEPERLVKYHDQFLEGLGSSWDDWRPLRAEQIDRKHREKVLDDLRVTIESEYGDKSPIVIKDPRICRFADIFIEALERTALQPHIVIPFRNPLAVCDSLEARRGMSKVKASLLWLRYNLDAEKHSRGYPRVFISYEQQIKAWRNCWQNIYDGLSIDWPLSLQDAGQTIDAFINPEQCHHKYGDQDLAEDPFLGIWVSAAYDILVQMQKAPDSQELMDALDNVSQGFHKATPLLWSASRIYEEKLVEYKRKESKHMKLIAGQEETIEKMAHSGLWSPTTIVRYIRHAFRSSTPRK